MTNLPVTGEFRVTCEYHKLGKTWIAGWHTGIDIVCDNRIIYATCDGHVYKIVRNNKDYGNYIVIKDERGRLHYFCHLASINVQLGDVVSRVSRIGVMGSTGKSTGIHLHYEIRTSRDKYNDTYNPAEYMGIPNEVGIYNSANYQIDEPTPKPEPEPEPQPIEPELKTLAYNTNLRDEPTTSSGYKQLYLANTTLYVLQAGVAENDGYTWDKVRIRVTGEEGYMINRNYK